MQLVEIPENPIPPNAIVELIRAERAELRVARWVEQPRAGLPCPGTVVIGNGRGEFIEKYAEVVDDLLRRGFAAVAFDWRGQGGSSRLLGDRRKGHIKDFSHYQLDLDALGATVLEPFCPKPWFAIGHSMGGAILIDHAARTDCLFERVVLSAPMMEVYGLKAVRAIRAMAAAASIFGLGAMYVPGGGRRSVMMQPFTGNLLTSDPRRYAAFSALVAAAPDLALGAPTQGWLHAAMRAMAAYTDLEFPRRIVTPVLVVACGADRVVETRATERFCTRLKAGRLIVIPHAEHEILMEQDRFRDQFWAAFDGFIPGTRSPTLATEPRRVMAG